MPDKITARFRITTPMFIGDAHQQASGISPAAVKGALRFWWRALNWGRLRNTEGATDESALRALHAEEAELFGSAEDKGAAQANALFRIKLDAIQYGLPQEKPGQGVQYLLGQGLYHFRNGFGRKTAVLSGIITLQIALKPTVTGAQTTQLVQAIQALGLLGALGSRARKGFGSIALESLKTVMGEPKNVPLVPENPEALQALLESWKPSFSGTLPPYSAFSTQTRVDVSQTASHPGELHEKAGAEMQLYRSWGRNGRVGSQPAEQNFKGDHDLVLTIGQGKERSPDNLPERSIFGLPHNYFFSSSEPKVQVDITPKDKDRSRRASPLFIHIHRFPNGKFSLIQTLLPALFLPAKEIVTFKPKRQRAVDVPFKQSHVDWQTLHAYLDRFEGEQVL